jgi:hypothetical protein
MTVWSRFGPDRRASGAPLAGARRLIAMIGVTLAAIGAIGLAAVWRLPGDATVTARTPSPAHARTSSSPAAARSRPPQAQVTISAHAATTPVPPSFLGVSTEYWALPVWAGHVGLVDRVLSLIHSDGPVLLRIGGDSADHVFWSPPREMPAWAFELTPGWLSELRGIVAHAPARLILDLNLVTATPGDATRWASTAIAELPRHSILGFEVGNEPDIYSRRSWSKLTRGGRGTRILPARITPAAYAGAFETYARALARVAPGAELLGPALAEPRIHLRWVAALLAGPHPGLGAVTVHRYALSACARPGSPAHPTIARILSEHASAGLARTVEPAVRLAAAAGLPLRVTEINSVTCGGTPGVSNTFATALWAPDALFSLLRTGVASAAVHVRADAVNAAFTIGRGGLLAHPLLYGMILFARMLGPHTVLVAVHLHNPHRYHLKAWAVRTPSRLNVLLIDKGSRSVRVRLRLPASGAATVQRLQAPSVRATSGETLTGQQLSASGSWRGRPVTQLIVPGRRGYQLTVAPYSAAMISVDPLP